MTTTAAGVRAVLVAIAELWPHGGVYVDAVIGGVPRDVYERLHGHHETLEERDGELVWAKDVHLPNGTVTVETSAPVRMGDPPARLRRAA